jgi:hypothetical protein
MRIADAPHEVQPRADTRREKTADLQAPLLAGPRIPTSQKKRCAALFFAISCRRKSACHEMEFSPDAQILGLRRCP